MTKVFLQPGLRGLKGGMGDWIYQIRRGKTIVGMRPMNAVKKEPTLPQAVQRKRFAEAAQYAKRALADPEKRAYYEKLSVEKDIPPFALAVADHMSVPTIQPLDLSEYVGQVGDPILITAQDKVGVVSVEVSLVTVEGALIEKGQAVETGSRTGSWVYTATASVPLGSDIFVEAEAFDMAGRRTVASANPIVGQED